MGNKKDLIDNNEALVKSLESIKALLAQSETKLSAARESLTQANKGPTMKKQKPEPDIPTLDEIVEAGHQIQIDLAEEDDIPVLESVETEAPVFKLDDEDDYDFGEATMTIDTSSMPFEAMTMEEDESEAIPVLAIEPIAEREGPALPEIPPPDNAAESAPPVEAVVELPDLSPLLNAIDNAEGTMRSQIAEAAITFEENLNSQLDVQMQKLRDQVYALVDKFGG